MFETARENIFEGFEDFDAEEKRLREQASQKELRWPDDPGTLERLKVQLAEAETVYNLEKSRPSSGLNFKSHEKLMDKLRDEINRLERQDVSQDTAAD